MDTLTLELIKTLPTVSIAALGIYIAYRQWRTAHIKVKLDLFDKRYEVFEAVWAFLSVATEKHPDQSLVIGAQNVTSKADFLFGSWASKYIFEAGENVSALNKLRESTLPLSVSEQAEMVRLKTWVEHEASEGIHKRFEEFLDFHRLR